MQKEPSNVIDFRTKKPLLPFQVRAILMAQYAESKDKEQPAEIFVQQLEQKLVTAAATTAFEMGRGFLNDLLKGRTDGNE